MKTTHRYSKLLMAGLLLASVMYNCKTKDVESLTPFTYSFTAFNNVKLPTVTPTAPASVTVTAATVTPSAAAAAVATGLSSLSATGTVPASVSQAAASVNKAISTTAAAQLSALFTPSVVSTFSSTGELPANLKAQLTALASNPALKAYLPTFTLPTINGKAVGGRVGATGGVDVVATVSVANATLDDDACKAAATKAFNTALDALVAAKTSQSAVIEKAYADAQASVNVEAAPCKAGLPAKYAPLYAAAQVSFNSGIASLDANKAVLGDTFYSMLKLLYLAALSDANDLFAKLQAAETTACDQVGATKAANAKAARDKDISTLNNNYNKAVSELNASLAKATASCHNQGNGG